MRADLAPRPFTDHFASIASSYAQFRPTYPAALFEWLGSIAACRDIVWDCAAGSGQASIGLADHFVRVIATDASHAQIAAATPHPAVDYRLAPADKSGLPDACVDIVTVAQALHWFDLDAFYAEVRRVSKPTGLVAVWSYGICTVEGPEIDAVVQRFYRGTLGPYWLPERAIVEAGYRTLPFPFEEIAAPPFAMTARWSLPELLGYFSSWSATARFIVSNARDPVPEIGDELAGLWGDPERLRTVTWPLALRVGKV
jgi:ubiquinone/menaquinone biosynthesis C-methylase UbiE